MTVNDRSESGVAVPAASLRELVERLETLGARRSATRPASHAARTRVTRLRDHLAGHLRVRARSLDAPVVVLLLGPTGAGKSTLFNTIAGRAASPTGVLRPTTRSAVVLAHPDDVTALREGTLAGVESLRLRILPDEGIARGLALVDAPDVDSVEHANRELADLLVEAADLCLFVTTATRYADRVPWLVLGRVRERGLPLIVVVNRLPPEAGDRRVVLEDVGRLFAEAGLSGRAGEAAEQGGALEVIGVTEGEIEPDQEALVAAAVAPVMARIEHLRSNREARVELAARALAGSLAGLGPLVDQVADDAAHEAIDAAALHRMAATHHDRGLTAVREAMARGTFLREEALRHWQDYVGADDVTRIFSKGIGAIRGAIASVFRPTQAPVAEIREATTDDLLGIARMHVSEAARRTASAWSEEPAVADAVADAPPEHRHQDRPLLRRPVHVEPVRVRRGGPVLQDRPQGSVEVGRRRHGHVVGHHVHNDAHPAARCLAGQVVERRGAAELVAEAVVVDDVVAVGGAGGGLQDGGQVGVRDPQRVEVVEHLVRVAEAELRTKL